MDSTTPSACSVRFTFLFAQFPTHQLRTRSNHPIESTSSGARTSMACSRLLHAAHCTPTRAQTNRSLVMLVGISSSVRRQTLKAVILHRTFVARRCAEDTKFSVRGTDNAVEHTLVLSARQSRTTSQAVSTSETTTSCLTKIATRCLRPASTSCPASISTFYISTRPRPPPQTLHGCGTDAATRSRAVAPGGPTIPLVRQRASIQRRDQAFEQRHGQE